MVDALRHVALISNPNARSAIARDALEAAARPLEARGWQVTIEETAGPGDASALAAAAIERGVEVVVACGGDGTLNEVLNGVASLQRGPGDPRPVVAIVPAGTANVWSHEAAIPSDPASALALIEDGIRRPFDLGVASIGGERRRFALMCGVGLDAAVTRAVEDSPGAKRRLGKLAFAWPSLRAVAKARGVTTTLTIGGVSEELALVQLVAGNTRLYGGLARITSGAVADDGYLDAVIFLDDGRAIARPWRLLREFGGALRGGLDHRRVAGVSYRRAALLELRPERELPVQVDGEPLGTCGPDAPLTLSVEPSAVTMVTPPGDNVLFSR
jgi:diacylglycerol kinase (ATP)